MDTDTIAGLMGQGPAKTTSNPANKTDNSFANQLKESTASSTEASQEKTAAESALDYIKEHGFTAYLEKLRIEKMEELREKLLRAMGLTEEDLDNMPMEARAAIEDRIAEEIKRRMAASIESDKEETTPNSDKAGLTSLVSSRPGISNGLALLQLLEQRQTPAEALGKNDGEDV